MAFLTCNIERIITDDYRFYNYTFSGKKKVAVEEPANLEVKPVEPEPAPVAPAPGKLLPQYYHNFLLVVNSFYTKLSNR